MQENYNDLVLEYRILEALILENRLSKNNVSNQKRKVKDLLNKLNEEG